VISLEQRRNWKKQRRLAKRCTDEGCRKYLLRQLEIEIEIETRLSQFSPLERETLEQQAKQRAASVRIDTWAKWLQREGWTVAEAAALLDGRDPDAPISGFETVIEKHVREERVTETLLREAVNNRQLIPVNPKWTFENGTYAPLELLALAFSSHIGLSGEYLKHISAALQWWASRPSALFGGEALKVRKPRRSTVERAEFVVACAKELAGLSDQDTPPEIRLPMNSQRFFDHLRTRAVGKYGHLAHMGAETLERARLDREGMGHLPKVHLQSGPTPDP
jgi:hypothetical protein